MIISICGCEKNKNEFMNMLQEICGNKIVICDLFNIKFNTIIETENMKYKLLDNCDCLDNARKEYQKIVDEKTNSKIFELINNNKDKIVLLLYNEVFSKDFLASDLFYNSDIKILFKDDMEYINYDEKNFDYLINKINIRKLVKKC